MNVRPSNISSLSLQIALALFESEARCYRDPGPYLTTVDGKPSEYPHECREFIHEKARLIDTVLNHNSVMQNWDVHCRIITELDGKVVFEGDLRFTCSELELPSVVLEHMEHFEPLWDEVAFPILIIDHYSAGKQ